MVFGYLFEIFWPQLAAPFDFHGPEALLVDIGYVHLTRSLDVIRRKILTIVTDNDRLDESGPAFRVFAQDLDLDVIPDFIPGLGWIDDVFVLTVVTNRLARVIEDYEAFRKRKLERMHS